MESDLVDGNPKGAQQSRPGVFFYRLLRGRGPHPNPRTAPHDRARALAHADRAVYLKAYDDATAALVRDSYVLAEDASALHLRAEQLWDEVSAGR